MKFLIFLFAFITLTISCNNSKEHTSNNIDSISVVNDYDSLAKYSYSALHEANGYLYGNGSGFFVRYKRQLFFITNYHVVTGINPATNKPSDLLGRLPDSLFITIKNATRPEDGLFLKVEVKKYHYNTKAFTLFDKPDIFAIPINENEIPFNYPINDLTALYDSTMQIKNSEQIIIWGYPFTDSMPPPEQKIVSEFYPDNKIFLPFISGNTARDKNLKDFDRFNYLITDTFKHGMSGSPIFCRYNINGSLKYSFGGIMFGSNHEINKGVAIKPQIIFDYLSKIKAP